jgi:hypothetical protein
MELSRWTACVHCSNEHDGWVIEEANPRVEAVAFKSECNVMRAGNECGRRQVSKQLACE